MKLIKDGKLKPFRKGNIPWNKDKEINAPRKCPYCNKVFKNQGALNLHVYYKHKGGTPWNKGLTKEDDERILRYALLKKGKPRPEEVKRKCRESKIRQYKENPELIERIRKVIIKVYKERPEVKDRIREGVIRAYMRGAYNIKPNNLESKVIELIKKYNLPYKYVGDGKFWVGKPAMNPDFVHNNGKKVVLEVLGLKRERSDTLNTGLNV